MSSRSVSSGSANAAKKQRVLQGTSKEVKATKTAYESEDELTLNAFKKNSTDNILETFSNYTKQADLQWYTSRFPVKVKDNEYRLGIIRRIDDAIRRNIVEIHTYQFFNFTDSMARGTLSEANAEISLVFCGENVEKKIIFNSNISNVACDSWSNVCYAEISRTLSLETDIVYILTKVTATMRSEEKRGNRRRESNAPQTKVAYFGARVVMKRENGVLSTHHTNSAVPMFTHDSAAEYGMRFFCDDQWETDPSKLKELSNNGQNMIRGGPCPQIFFELIDEHSDENWNLLNELAMCRSNVRNPIHLPTIPFIVSSQSEKENTSPDDMQSSHHVIVNAREEYCPICLRGYSSVEELLRHMNVKYTKLRFTKADNGEIEVSLRTSSHKKIETTTWDPVVIHNVKKGDVIPQSLLACQHVHFKQREEFGSERMFHNAVYKNSLPDMCRREMDEFVDIRESDRRFMQMFNEYTMKHQFHTSQNQTDRFMENFIESHRDVIKNESLGIQACHLVALLAARARIGPTMARKLCALVMSDMPSSPK